ncbi:MAG: cbb3-type cytochrome c oxidase N-terminal domain-containing protein [Planctomycetota bacterium]
MPETPDQKDILTSHNYDGIQEYDNPTPGWWTWLFIGSIFFGLLYCLVFIFAEDVFGVHTFYEQAEAANLAKQYGQIEGKQPDAETLTLFVKDPEQQKWLAAGQAVFTTNCVACHGSGGIGGSGPNLTDEHYKNVRRLTDIVKVIEKGAANGAMPAWENRLKEPEVLVVSAYVASLRGQNVAGGKPPEPEAKIIDPFFE